ncbi:MAG: hypothetical protein UH654_01735 [Lachnospiraceae bacterium]|nr:hypothetical protein [Lachnospiraceae bacterium]
MGKLKECDDDTFYNASIDFLIEALTQDGIEECQKQISADTDDDYAKVKPYERKTTEER